MVISLDADILDQLPSLKILLDQYGDMNLLEYWQKSYRNEVSSPLLETRKEEFLELLGQYTRKKFDVSLSEKVTSSLKKNYAVSTAEHHGPMWHPFFFQSAILRGLVHPEEPIINFCTSHVSLGNSSYPRGLIFHGDGDLAPPEYLHLPFFSAQKRMCPVFQLEAYTKENIRTSCLSKLQSYLRKSYITEETYKNIENIIQTSLLREDLLSCKSYTEQITRFNHRWWQELFPELPDFIPLDAEDIVTYILWEHLHKETLLTHLLTDMDLQPLIEERFNGISCCFDLEKKSWTYLFWYIDDHHVRHSLWRKWDELSSNDESFRVKIDSRYLLPELSSWKLIPSGLLVYTVLSCYYGLTCFGWFAQGNYLPKIQKAYQSLLQGKNKEEENLSTQTSLLNEDMVFLHEENGEISTALDLALGWTPWVSQMLQNAQKTTIRQSLASMLPEIARCL